MWGVNAMLFKRYFEGLRILSELPVSLKDPAEVTERMQAGKPFTVEVPRGIVARYDHLMETTKEKTRLLAPDLPPFKTLQIQLFALRLLAVGLALADLPWLALLLSTAQCLLAPCSLFVSCCMFIALAPPLFLGHYVVWGLLQGVSWAVLPGWLQPSLPINLPFIVALFVLDQGLCFRLTRATPAGPAQALPAGTLFKHCWYGFLNCKTYELLILLCARSWGCRVDLVLWLLDAYLGLSRRAAALAERRCGTWAFLFYTQHRMGHLPKVYDSAHKFHHTFRDSTAFDAHLYGSGMPEELVCIFVEAVGAALGVCPMSLGHYGLTQSWANKLGHARKEDGAGGMNEHADHHKEHNKNYGICNPMLDMLLGTRCDNKTAEYGCWRVQKTETDDVVRFDWSLTPGGKDIIKDYYGASLSRDLLNLVRNKW